MKVATPYFLGKTKGARKALIFLGGIQDDDDFKDSSSDSDICTDEDMLSSTGDKKEEDQQGPPENQVQPVEDEKAMPNSLKHLTELIGINGFETTMKLLNSIEGMITIFQENGLQFLYQESEKDQWLQSLTNEKATSIVTCLNSKEDLP